jgi:hypothetical protein
VTIRAICGVKRRKIELLDTRQNEPRQVILRQPVAQARRHQQLLVAVAGEEVLRHRWIVETRRDGVVFVRQPRPKAAACGGLSP